MTVETDADLIDRLYAGAADPELDDMRLVRGLVARVRDEMHGVEPPPSISARLLQAAAPARSGVWARLRRWFAQPAVAAMATLVLVAGAAALWMRQGKSASPSISTTEVGDEASEHASSDLAVETSAPTSALPPAPAPTQPPPRKAPASKPADKPVPAPVAKSDVGDESVVLEGDSTTTAPPAPPPPSNQAPVPSTNDAARRLTRQAVVAGEQGDCARVKELAKQVQKLDPEWYSAGFLPEPDIRDCGVK